MSTYKQEMHNATAIRQEIQRFESVHPNIYAIYDLLQNVKDSDVQNQIREHLINIEDSFVNSQEWTLSKFVPEFRLGILGSINSGKSSLVHRFLTGSYVREESPEGGRFKKEMVVDGQSHLLLVRDEGGPPEEEFSSWVDGIIFVFNLADEASFHSIYNYYARLLQYRNVSTLPLVLVGTQDFISNEEPRVIFEDRAKKLAADLKRCVYYETCATYGLNVDRVFQDLAQKVFFVKRRFEFSSNNIQTTLHSTPLQRSISTSSSLYDHNGTPSNGSAKSLQAADSTLSISGSLTPTPLRKSTRRRSNLFSSRKSSESSEDKKKNNSDFGFGRNIPVKQGWLFKRTSKTKISNKEWKKKYVALEDNGSLTYYNTMQHYMENIHKKSLSVMRTTIKIPGRPFKSSPSPKAVDDNFEFHLVSMDGITWQFLTACAAERDEWVSAIERQIMLSFQNNSPYKKSNISEMSFHEVAGNNVCVDCSAPSPTWGSLNLGCLMCIECSGIHRNLGTHISRIRSLELDDWTPEYYCVIEKVGNFICNSIWEGATIPVDAKPSPTSSRHLRETFIRDKYENKSYLMPLPARYASDPTSSLCYAIADGNYQLIMHLLAYLTRDDINRPIGSEKQTPLHVACSIGDLASIQLLLWMKANPCLVDSLGQTPSVLAEQSGHLTCSKLLDAANRSKTDDETAMSQRCGSDVTSNGVNGRTHVNYIYTSAI